MTLQLAGTIAPSVWYLANHTDALTPTERAHLGLVARRLLAFALEIAPDDRGLLTVGITAVNTTTSTEVTPSIALLRECITPERLQGLGFRTLRTLAEGVSNIAAIDHQYVHDLYLAALQHQETSQETTNISESQILALTSQRQQDYRSGLYLLGQQYPAYLAVNVTSAIRTLRAALEEFAREHYRINAQPQLVNLGGYQAGLLPDGSRTWDLMDVYGQDLPITMLSTLQARLQSLADENDLQTIERVISVLAEQPIRGIAWRRLLQAATTRPGTLGNHVRELAWDTTILTHPDTTIPAGHFIRAIHPLLTPPDRERIEQAIVALPTTSHGTTGARNRLITCLNPAAITGEEVREQYAVLTQQGQVPITIEEEEGPAWMSLGGTPNDALQAVLDSVTNFIAQYASTVPDAAAITSTLPLLHALDEALTSPTEPITTERATAAINELLSASIRIACCAGLTEAQCTQLLITFLRHTTHADPSAEHEVQTRPLGGHSNAPRIQAAEGIILLARYPAACTTDSRAAIQRLSIDPVRAVRAQIATRLACLYNTATDLFWDLLEYFANHEPNPTLMVATLQLLRRLSLSYAPRSVQLAQTILQRTPTTADYKDVHDACIHVFCRLALHAEEPTSKALLDQYLNDPATHASAVHRIVLDICPQVTADLPVRERAFTLMEQALTAITGSMQQLESSHAATNPWPQAAQEQYRALFECADEIGQRLYFASGAFKHPDEGRPLLPPEVFYERARPLLIKVAGIGHPHTAHNLLKTLQYFIPVDPKGVLLLSADVVCTGSKYGYQYEQLAEGVMVDIVDRYLAEYRWVIRDQQGSYAALMDILDVFVRVGWPRAHQLTYRLSEIYR